MARTTKIVSFSVPPATEKEFEQVAKKEQRTKSELFREMLRFYRAYRVEIKKAAAARLAEIIEEDIRQGLQDISSGNTVGAFHSAEELDLAVKRRV